MIKNKAYLKRIKRDMKDIQAFLSEDYEHEKDRYTEIRECLELLMIYTRQLEEEL